MKWDQVGQVGHGICTALMHLHVSQKSDNDFDDDMCAQIGDYLLTNILDPDLICIQTV